MDNYSQLNNAWKKTCKVLLGEEIGELKTYKEWLTEIIDNNTIRKSNISGKDVAFAIKDYSPDSKWISFDEIDFDKKFEPLNINEIKDIDSIVEAVSDHIYYCGNILLGNCNSVERSSHISDGFVVADSAQFFNVKYMGYCTLGRENSYCFGSHAPGGSEFLIRCSQTVNVKRSFELWVSMNSSDCYYVSGLDNCSNCLFSFNLKSRRNCIGNLELSKDKFETIKRKLLSEIVDELKRKKFAPSLLEIVGKCTKEKAVDLGNKVYEPAERFDRKIIEDKFSNTTKVIFGKSLVGIDNYSDWLRRHVRKPKEAKSAVSGRQILWLPYGVSLLPLPENRIVTMNEADSIGETTAVEPTEAENMSLKNAHESIGKIAYFKVDFREGKNTNLIDCTYCISCSHCYKVSMMVRSKYCACSMWPKDSNNSFGIDSLMNSDFCVNCYHSTKLTRCFEMDSCSNCTDSIFCHNCENLNNCMFCFNIKSKKYAIANVEVGREKYMEIKKKVLEEITSKLIKNKKLEKSIYTLSPS